SAPFISAARIYGLGGWGARILAAPRRLKTTDGAHSCDPNSSRMRYHCRIRNTSLYHLERRLGAGTVLVGADAYAVQGFAPRGHRHDEGALPFGAPLVH